ncbi:MAG: RNA methyltransferase [Muribaculaceae bacterium]|nr:RNA methyltransferase [Muribaculaceae bacterium]
MVIEINSITDKSVEIFGALTERDLRSRRPDLFIAESPKVILRALECGYEPVSMLCERKHIEGDAAEVIAKCGAGMPVYTAGRDVLAALTGYTLTRGVLCAMRRKPESSPADICREATRIAVIDEVCDATNVGAIFRSAAALGVDAVLVTRGSCDPLNRRAVRVSMGNVFSIPWTWTDTANDAQQFGFRTAAFALTDQSVSLDDPKLNAEPRLAIILGGEGYGLDSAIIRNADYTVKIPMARGVDSLNVAACAAVAFWQLRRR